MKIKKHKLKEIKKANYDIGFSEGHNFGYNDGYNNGHEEGYDEGQSDVNLTKFKLGFLLIMGGLLLYFFS